MRAFNDRRSHGAGSTAKKEQEGELLHIFTMRARVRDIRDRLRALHPQPRRRTMCNVHIFYDICIAFLSPPVVHSLEGSKRK
jgi:hypothetical protein